MNDMQSKDQELRTLSLSIGNFIRYWGFRRVHGAIWTQLYLSKSPLSCTDLARRLKVSKSLVSPALEELCRYRLIREAPAPNEKTKVYFAVENINEVIQHVLKSRETKMLKQITKDYSKFSEGADVQSVFNSGRIKTLGEMILSANFMLEIFTAQEDILKIPLEFEK